MLTVLIIALSIHVLSAVFWAGTSFTLARAGSTGGERLLRPQMGAAIVAFLSGGYLWSVLHDGRFGTTEQVLALGVVCAVAAAGVQGAMGGPAVRALRANDHVDTARRRFTIAQRIASGLLAVTLVCMVAARYAA